MKLLLFALANAAIVTAEIPGSMRLMLDPVAENPGPGTVSSHQAPEFNPIRSPTYLENAQLAALGEEILKGAQQSRQTSREQEEVSPYLQQAEAQRRLIDAQERAKEAEFARRNQELRQISELIAAESQAAATQRRQFESSVQNLGNVNKQQDTGPREAGMLLSQGPTLSDRELNAISLYPDTMQTTDQVREKRIQPDTVFLQNIPAWGLAEQARKLPTETDGPGQSSWTYKLPDEHSMVNDLMIRLEKAQSAMQSHCSATEIESLGFLLLQAIREAAHGSQ